MSTIHSLEVSPPARETLLCVHASATNGLSLDKLVAPLRARFNVLQPVRLGYGIDDAFEVGASASYDAETDHLSAVFERHPEGVHLFGHSFGGAVAMQLALRWPGRVKSLALYEPGRFSLLFGDAASRPVGEAIVDLARTAETWMVWGRLRDAAALFVDYWSGPGTWDAMDTRRQETVIRHMPKVRAEFEAAFADPLPLEVHAAALTMPVRVIVGATSPLPGKRVGELLAASLPQAEFVCLPEIGHMGPVTHARQVFGQLPADWQPYSQALAA